MIVYSLYDVCTSEYGNPFTAINDEDCKRRLRVQLKGNPFYKDLKLFEIGAFLSDTGAINPCVSPNFVCNVSDIFEDYPDGQGSIIGGD